MENKSLAIFETIVDSHSKISNELKKLPSSKKKPFTKTYNRRPRKEVAKSLAFVNIYLTVQSTLMQILRIQSQPIPKYSHGKQNI